LASQSFAIPAGATGTLQVTPELLDSLTGNIVYSTVTPGLITLQVPGRYSLAVDIQAHAGFAAPNYRFLSLSVVPLGLGFIALPTAFTIQALITPSRLAIYQAATTFLIDDFTLNSGFTVVVDNTGNTVPVVIDQVNITTILIAAFPSS